MTNEEAIARIKDHKIAHKMNEPRAIFISEALDMAIKALEQEDIVEKIRADILRISSYEGFELGGVRDGYTIAIVNVLKIIDKYRK